MVYLSENTDTLTEEFLIRGKPFLSQQRSAKIEQYGSQRDRIDGCAAYLLLRYALFREYGICEAPLFTFGEHEKPFLQDYPAVYFNLSHCKTAVGCIVSEHDTAIDVTDRRRVRNNVFRRVCSKKEQEQLAVSDDPDNCFLRMWTRKECLAKLTGEGMSRPFHTITDEWQQAANVYTEEHSSCILSYYAETPLSVITVSVEELFKTLESI